MGICGIDAACGRNAPEEISVSTYVSVVPHVGHAGSGGRADASSITRHSPTGPGTGSGPRSGTGPGPHTLRSSPLLEERLHQLAALCLADARHDLEPVVVPR